MIQLYYCSNGDLRSDSCQEHGSVNETGESVFVSVRKIFVSVRIHTGAHKHISHKYQDLTGIRTRF